MMRFCLKHKSKNICRAFGALMMFVLLCVVLSSAAKADCSSSRWDDRQDQIKDNREDLIDFIIAQFRQHEIWWVGNDGDPGREDFWNDHIYPALHDIPRHLFMVGEYQVLGVGMLFDGKHQVESEMIFSNMAAEAQKEYQPSMGMCAIGTNTRSLAETERKARYVTAVLGKRAMDRHLGNVNVNAAAGAKEDSNGRLALFKARYCDLGDNNNGLSVLCDGAAAPAATQNKDVSYFQTMEMPRTLELDFAASETGDEIDVIALENNLYGHDVFTRPSRYILDVKANQDEYMDLRALLAKRSVAEYSFNKIAGMKAAGSEIGQQTGVFARNALKQLAGINDDEAVTILGERPSYYAQMEILAQKLYQDPEFYTSLYDKPANVLRKDVAMQAINLMLDRDTYNSELRYEAMLAVLLEMDVERRQKKKESRRTAISSQGKGH